MISTIKRLMNKQAGLMLEFGELEQGLQTAIMNRDWPGMERLVSKMGEIAGSLVVLDQERHEAIQAEKRRQGLREEDSFHALLARLEPPVRADLTALYRSLQVSVLRVKSVTGGIDAYVRGSIRTTNEMLSIVFPDQRGTIYSRQGQRAPADQRAIVLDQHL